MRLGWDEIKRRAKAFSEDWKDAHYEKGETHSFYNDFFEIFGVKRRQVAVYEKLVQGLDANRRGFIDLFWPGTLIVEQKSAGKDLLAAQMQASEYFNWLSERDQPRFMLTCDFQRWNLIDLDDNGRELSFRLADLHKHITAFDFMLGRKVSFATQAGVTIKAAELMGKLHDALEDSGYVGHDLEQLLVRLLFCLFADDTGVFQPKDIFLQLVENDTGQMAVALHVASDPALALDLLVFTLADGDTLVWRSRPATTIRGGVPAGPIITTPDALRLNIEPMADCGRYDSIRMLA